MYKENILKIIIIIIGINNNNKIIILCVCYVVVFCSGINGGDVWGCYFVIVFKENINGKYIIVLCYVLW